MRFFLTPRQKVHFGTGTACCWRLCGARDAGHWHIFWECPKIKLFWLEFQKALISIFKVNNIPLQFSTVFWGNFDNMHRHEDKYLYTILTVAAKKAITRCWLLPEPPATSEWINIVNEIYVMESITFSIRLRRNTFVKLWSKWVRYILPLRPDFVEVRT